MAAAEIRPHVPAAGLLAPSAILERFVIETICQQTLCSDPQVSRLKPELAPLSMPVRPAGRPSGGNAASELRLLRRSGALSR